MARRTEKRISIEDLELMFGEIQGIPVQHTLNDGAEYDALGAVCAAMDWTTKQLVKAYGDEYLCGFLVGWDGGTLDHEASRRMVDGQSDGLLCWLAR